MKLQFTHARLWTGEEEFTNGCVQIEDNRIVYAGDAAKAPAFCAEETIDTQGGIVAPGFYNTHSHAAMTLLRGLGSDKPLMDWLSDIWPIEDRLSDELVYAGSMIACMEMLRRGCVLCNDMYLFMEGMAKAVAETGMRALLGRGIVSMERLEENNRLYQVWNGAANDRIRVAVAPYAEYGVSEELYRECVAQAQRQKAILHTHASETRAEVEACKERHNGLSPIRLLDKVGVLSQPCIAAHCVWVDEEEMDLLAKSGVYVSHNPASNCKLGSGIMPAARMLARGVSLSLGTDGPASSNTMDMLADMRLMSLLAKASTCDATAMDARTALTIATRNGALACGLPDAGLLKRGYLADLVVYTPVAENLLPLLDVPSTLVYAAQCSNVRMTIVDGRVAYREGTFPLFDGVSALADAQKAIQTLYS